MVCDEHTAKTRAGFEYNILDRHPGLALFLECVCSRKSGDPAADDGNAFHGCGDALLLNALTRRAAVYNFSEGCG